MTGRRRRLALAAGLLVVVSPTAAVAAAGVGSRVLFRIADQEIYESSGLVDTGAVIYTINDSGSGPVLFGIDPHSGDTVSVTTYSPGEVTDVEAVAPGRDGRVWVGDLGDNLRARDSVTVYDVTPGASEPAPAHRLTYPDGARDAETLLADPRTGRLYVVSKTVFGGVVYAAPRRLDASGVLRPVAQVPGLVTDGAFFPDGKHVLLRGYGTASVYTFPDFDLVGTVTLPDQEQGEGVSIGPDGRVLLSSEGLHSEVLEISLPENLTRGLEGPTEPSPTASPSGDASLATDPGNPLAGAAPDDRASTTDGHGWWWLLLPAGGAAVGVGLVVRGRGPRRGR